MAFAKVDIETTMTMSNQQSRELYRYFNPHEFKANFDPADPHCHDQMLASQTQLVAMVLNVWQCNISFIDGDSQYNIAAGARLAPSECTPQGAYKGHNLWVGCIVDKDHIPICRHTLQLPRPQNGTPASFEILDVDKDSRFSYLPFVASAPRLRYYFGIPLITTKEIAIGTLYVMDIIPRAEMTANMKQFLYGIATNVMNHLELLRESTERKRAIRMSKGLDALLHQGARIYRSSTATGEPSASPSRRCSVSSNPSAQTDQLKSNNLQWDYITHEDIHGGLNKSFEIEAHVQFLNRAATLLHKALHLEDGGGVIFFDIGYANPPNHSPEAVVDDTQNEFRRQRVKETMTDQPTRGSRSKDFAKQNFPSRRTNSGENDQDEAHILANYATSNALTLPFDKELLRRFAKYYPQGHLWVANSRGEFIEQTVDYADDFIKKSTSYFLARFPKTFQLIFFPMWNAVTGQWIACFATSTSPYRVFTYNTELLYCIAFKNRVTIELTRIAKLNEEKQKGDFMSSISHELRSPLHGILAACDFLGATETCDFQTSLIQTVDNCAKTLVDTINMVLDYSRINSFEKDWRKAKDSDLEKTLGLSPHDSDVESEIALQKAPNLYARVNLAAITEEVVEGVATARLLHQIPGFDQYDKASRLEDVKPENDTVYLRKRSSSLYDTSKIDEKRVEVVVAIDAQDWMFVTQPGAFRRIIMNLVGNALKYTPKGWIQVSLNTQKKNETSDEDENDVDEVVLTITDTGKGISQEFLDTKLFQAFSQEDHLASGMGLGLSLVRSIINTMNGKITIDSRVDKGTTVTVTIPMVKDPSNDVMPALFKNPLHGMDENIAWLQNRAKQCHLAYLPDHTSGTSAEDFSHGSRKVQECMSFYFENWFQLAMNYQWSELKHSGVVIADEAALELLLSHMPKDLKLPGRPSILLLCSSAARSGHLARYASFPRFYFITKPFGPYKLARCLRTCLERNMQADKGSEYEDEHSQHSQASFELQNRRNPSGTSKRDQYSEPSPTSNVSGLGQNSEQRDYIDPEETIESSTIKQKPSPELAMQLPHTVSSQQGSACKDGNDQPLHGFTSHHSHARHSNPPTGSTIPFLSSSSSSPNDTFTSTSTTGATLIAASLPDPSSDPPMPSESPRVLLVDDNAINLRLLRTFINKRAYRSIVQAENGAIAVEAFRQAFNVGKTIDIVFMDVRFPGFVIRVFQADMVIQISMPIMDGFEATKRIRHIESDFKGPSLDESSTQPDHIPQGLIAPTKVANVSSSITGILPTVAYTQKMPLKSRVPALIIALTGLASAKDRAEANACGVDLFVTKPVRFREVGILLDSWERKAKVAKSRNVTDEE